MAKYKNVIGHVVEAAQVGETTDCLPEIIGLIGPIPLDSFTSSGAIMVKPNPLCKHRLIAYDYSWIIKRVDNEIRVVSDEWFQENYTLIREKGTPND